MEKYTIPQIVEQRICIAPMTKEQFEKFKQKSVEYLKIDSKKFDVKYFENGFYILEEKPSRISCSELDISRYFTIISCKKIEFSQIDFEENKVENPNDLIGHKIKGFKFDNKYKCGYAESMDKYIGESGKITFYSEYTNSFRVYFEPGFCYNYPAELIHLHLVEEETNNEKFEPKFKNCAGCGKKIFIEEADTLKEEIYCNVECLEIFGKTEPEELDLTKILIEGETYYSPLLGYLIFERKTIDWLCFKTNSELEGSSGHLFSKEGKYNGFGNSECMIFPSKEIRTWENYSPFKKGEVCLFWNKNGECKYVGLFYKFEEGNYWSGCINNETLILEDFDNFKFCERFDHSKFNF